MKTLDRVFLTLLMLVLMALCVLVVLFCLGVFSIPELAHGLIIFDGSWLYKIIAIVSAILLFVLSIKVMFHRSRTGAGMAEGGERHGSRHESRQLISVGNNVQITEAAVNSIMQKAALNGPGVTGAACMITKNSDGTFAAQISATMADGVNVPQAAAAMDQRVKESLSAACGITDIVTSITIGK